jgi:N-acetylglucosamine-6-phosphate deacetylase
LWRVLDLPGLTVSLIPDTIHVSPMFFRIAHKVLPAESILYTTDAMSAAGAPPGKYTIGALEVEVGSDGIMQQPGRTNFAGSSLRPIDGVFRAARMLERRWQEVWDGFATRPAKLMGIRHGLEPGCAASFCRLTERENGNFLIQTWINGTAAWSTECRGDQ